MERKIVECVPNFSEGRDQNIIAAIVEAIASVEGVKVLNVDPGAAANRTVVTFAGELHAVAEAAFQGAKRAAELIDMRLHSGEHPRIGATDVLPIVPISGVTLEECAEVARGVAQRIYEELGVPTYCYEASAQREWMRNLAVCRSGEYESLPQKICDERMCPDFGGGVMSEQALCSGASVVGARNFLIAVNFTLCSDSAEVAQQIAEDVREIGRVRVDEHSGEKLRDEHGTLLRKHGPLKGCKAIGWYIEEYGAAQVSMNITDITKCSLHAAYQEVVRAAHLRGVEVRGTEIIAMVPKCVVVDAGRYFAAERAIAELTDDAAIELAIEVMRLSDIETFDPQRKIIENQL